MVRLETSEQKRCTPVKTANKWDDIVHTIHPKDPVVNPLFTYFFCFPLPRGAIRPPPPLHFRIFNKTCKGSYLHKYILRTTQKKQTKKSKNSWNVYRIKKMQRYSYMFEYACMCFTTNNLLQYLRVNDAYASRLTT